jgi:hypothetical protein|tara:strand:+ start:966 stop:1175 length:210 start_codon:yes stop_codon:yes gene_type:complete
MTNIHVNGHPDLSRDKTSGGIVNTNVHSYEQYMEAYKNRIQKEDRLDKIEQEIGELKDLLKQVVNHINT